jgi:hypothetical protein|tara:strand:- start:45 stop:221 length:177 start_codon:yes stop_codon:yes gene_type:complete
MAYPTNPIYKLCKDKEGREICIITQVNGLQLCIPFCEDNTDYQKYLEWAKTNTAEEAD